MKRGERRRLQKFGLYSVSLVLPKQYLAELGWDAGDTVRVRLDVGAQTVTIDQGQSTPVAPAQRSTSALSPAPSRTADHSAGTEPERTDDVLPIPELP